VALGSDGMAAALSDRTRFTRGRAADGGRAHLVSYPIAGGGVHLDLRRGYRVDRSDGCTAMVEATDCDDANLFVGVEKWRAGKFVPFEGSFGYGRDRVATGWQRAALRRIDPSESRPWEPVPTFTDPQPLSPARSSRSTSHWALRRPCSARENNCACLSRRDGWHPSIRSSERFHRATRGRLVAQSPCIGARIVQRIC